MKGLPVLASQDPSYPLILLPFQRFTAHTPSTATSFCLLLHASSPSRMQGFLSLVFSVVSRDLELSPAESKCQQTVVEKIYYGGRAEAQLWLTYCRLCAAL